MGADEFLTARREGGHTRHALGSGVCPIGIDLIPEAAFLKHLSSENRRKANGFCNAEEGLGIPDITSVNEIRSEQCIVDRLPSSLGLGPMPQLLRQAAVVSVCPRGIGQALRIRRTFEAGVHGVDVHATSGKQVFQEAPVGGRFRMQGKVHPPDRDVECLFQPFNTPGTEVAPGSDVVAEDFQ